MKLQAVLRPLYESEVIFSPKTSPYNADVIAVWANIITRKGFSIQTEISLYNTDMIAVCTNEIGALQISNRYGPLQISNRYYHPGPNTPILAYLCSNFFLCRYCQYIQEYFYWAFPEVRSGC